MLHGPLSPRLPPSKLFESRFPFIDILNAVFGQTLPNGQLRIELTTAI